MQTIGGNKQCGIYVHVPYCKSKCLYCAFYSIASVKADWRRFVSAILSELRQRIAEISGFSSYTLYFGGGTPSLIPADEFRRLSSGIKEILAEVSPRSSIIETTIEANPDDISPALADCWKDCGVDRVSMGVQSLNDAELKAIGRRHDSSRAIEAFNILRERFDNISLDLMFGLPKQTIETLTESIDGIVGLSPEHISAYSLTFEERSALTRLRDSGRIAETAEDISVGMFRLIDSRLADAGYERYEISNYSKPGRRSQHNSAYWHGLPYIGLGPSAHSYDGERTRSWNISDIESYLYAIESGKINRGTEILTEEELREESIMTSLRTAEGIDLEAFATRFGAGEKQALLKSAAPHLLAGTLATDSRHLRLTHSGVMISDEIIADLF